jgi:hypothetical protein
MSVMSKIHAAEPDTAWFKDVVTRYKTGQIDAAMATALLRLAFEGKPVAAKSANLSGYLTAMLDLMRSGDLTPERAVSHIAYIAADTKGGETLDCFI